MEILFSKGSSGSAYPVKLMCVDAGAGLPSPAQAMFVAPKRSFKRAHDRNKLKRRMREVYRLQKSELYAHLNENNKNVLLAFIYTGKKIEDYKLIEAAIVKLLDRRFKR